MKRLAVLVLPALLLAPPSPRAQAPAPGGAAAGGGQRGVIGAELPPGGATPQLDKLTLPKGFQISIYADKVPGARSRALGSDRANMIYRITYGG